MRDHLQELLSTVRPTTWIHSARIDSRLGCEVLFASETFQRTGSFKFRAAYWLASNVENSHLITASSGNFGQALAYACKLLGKRATIVMPETSASVKIDAVREFGGEVELVDITRISRAERVQQLAVAHPNAYVASAYDDRLVVEGNSSLAVEIVESGREFDAVVVPIGGGGLASGLVTGFASLQYPTHVFGAEPLLANDAARSFREGELIRNDTEPQTLADGARTVSLGDLNWEILQEGLDDILEVPEADIEAGVMDLFLLANLKVEPTGALAYAAIKAASERFSGRMVCCVISGGNVDPKVYASLVAK